MRKKFEVLSGGRDTPKRRKFEEGEETFIVTSCIIVTETPKALLIRRSIDDINDTEWVPKSKVELNTHADNKLLHDIEMPEWMAKEKGFYEE